METRPFGSTGLRVSVLGFGAGQIGGDDCSDSDAERLLGAALDGGVTFIDTARSYGRSEERIGRLLAHRRHDFVLSTKGGYGVEGAGDWTYDAVARGIHEALGRLRTDVIDVFHLHSCSRQTLERGEVVRALEDARRAGKIRVAAYSGENDALDHAVDSGAFGSIQCSVNLFDQRSLDGPIARAKARGMGVIAKRALANAPWRFEERPHGDYCEVYWDRMQRMIPDPRIAGVRSEAAWTQYALYFSVFAPGVDTALVGTRRMEHLNQLVCDVLGAGPAGSPRLVEDARAWFRDNDRDWVGQV
jgi:aryl-alcohol dehydrogenase-like predicted oxidoreductase